MQDDLTITGVTARRSNSMARDKSASDILQIGVYNMQLHRAFWWGTGILLIGTLSAFQLPFREFPGVEYSVGDIPLPADYQEKTEWTFARLMYPPAPRNAFGRGYGGGFGSGGFGGGGRGFRGNGVWTEGGTIWTQ